MKANLETKRPSIRCRHCGDARVVAVCHHCGVALCAQHEQEASVQVGVSYEFSDLRMEPGRVAHCRRCAHSMRKPISGTVPIGLLVGGIALLALGIRVGAAPFTLGAILLLAAAGAAWRRERQWKKLLSQRPEFPALPQPQSFEVEETIKARQVLGSDGVSKVNLIAATGHAQILAMLTESDRDRLRRFAAKYKLSDLSGIPVSAGNVGFDPGVRRDSEDRGEGEFTTLLPLRSSVERLPYLTGATNRAAAEWRHEVAYRLGDQADDGLMPLRMVPSLARDLGRRDLQLELSWRRQGREASPDLEQIDTIELRYPAELGHAKCIDGLVASQGGDVDERGDAWITARINRPTLAGAGGFGNGARPDYRRFFLHFESPIRPGMTIHGRAVATLRGARSGLQQVLLFSPLGFRREQARAEVRTHLELEFQLSTTPLLYSVLKLMPAATHANPEDQAPAPEVRTEVFEGANASHDLVISLTNELGRSGFYVKSVTEESAHQDHRGNAQGHARHRTWDILGRRYHGVHPTEFHLVLHGEEFPAQGRCRLTVSLNAQGFHADSEDGHRIESDWDEVSEVVRRTVGKTPGEDGSAPSEPLPPQPSMVQPSAPLPHTSASTSALGGPMQEATRKYKEGLLAAFLEKKIPEDLFRKLMADLDSRSGSDSNVPSV